MMMSAAFSNVYDDETRAAAYAKLEFPGTYYLAYRDLPAILGQHVQGTRALDFGCGTGRSTRFVRKLGFDVVGVDIAEHMIARARELDREGDYRLVAEEDLDRLPARAYDLVLSVFTFDNIPTRDKKVSLFEALRRRIKDTGRIVSIVSSPEIYTHEWTSFTTRDFPENRHARTGDTVRIIILDVDDSRPVEDVIWEDDAYRDVYRQAGLAPLAMHRPLARQDEPFAWVSELSVPPWSIYVLGPADRGKDETGEKTRRPE